MKLFEVKDKYEDIHVFYYDDGYFSVKDYIKRHLDHMSFDLRTVKEIPFPKGRFEATDMDDCFSIFYNGKAIVSWNDCASRDYPEDLTWNRDISQLIEDVERLKELEFEDRINSIKKDIG